MEAETLGEAPDYSMNTSFWHRKIYIYHIIQIIFKTVQMVLDSFFLHIDKRAVSAVSTHWFIKQTQYLWNVLILVHHTYSFIFGAHMFMWSTFSSVASVKMKSTAQVIHSSTQLFLLVYRKQANCIPVLGWWHYVMHNILIVQWQL